MKWLHAYVDCMLLYAQGLITPFGKDQFCVDILIDPTTTFVISNLCLQLRIVTQCSIFVIPIIGGT